MYLRKFDTLSLISCLTGYHLRDPSFKNSNSPIFGGAFGEGGGLKNSDIILRRGLSNYRYFQTWGKEGGGPKTGKKFKHHLWMTPMH